MILVTRIHCSINVPFFRRIDTESLYSE